MTVTTDAFPGVQLSFDRTYSRDLVHRAALEEVLLTDIRSLPDGRFAAAAQLPRGHHYYTDHLATPRGHDPLAVLEAVRQALLCAIHVHHDVPRASKSIMAECRLELTSGDVLQTTSGDYHLAMIGEATDEQERDGTLSRVVHQVELRLGGRRIGRVTIDTAVRPPQAYQKLRMRFRDTAPPRSDTIVPPAGHAVAALAVGRERAGNVVLLDVARAGGELAAVLRVPVEHTSMFDHPHDHVPGPVMIEAARQAALLVAEESAGWSVSRTALREVHAGLERFAELDAAITVHAEALPAAEPGTLPVAVTFTQHDAAVARMRVVVANTVERRHAL